MSSELKMGLRGFQLGIRLDLVKYQVCSAYLFVLLLLKTVTKYIVLTKLSFLLW